MSMIFGVEAPKYWAVGLSAIPLQVKEKKPVAELLGWAKKYCIRLPDLEEQTSWVARYPDNNMGLALGKASNLVIVDIDTDDQKMIDIITAELPPSPWVRIGQKGYALAYRYNGQKNWQVNIAANETGKADRLMDFLSDGRQVVLPPSIHPDTGQPYVANCNLYDVVDQLVELPTDVHERITAKLKLAGVKISDSIASAAKFTGKAAKGERDNRMIQIAGKSARAVLLGEISVRRAIDDMYGWYEQEVEKDPSDQLDIEKGVNSFLGFLVNDVRTRNMQMPVGWDAGLSDDEKKSWGLNFDADHEDWTPQRLMQHIQQSLTADSSAGNKNEVLNFTLKKVAKSKSYSVIDADQIFQYLKSTLGDKTSVAVMKKRVQELQEGPVTGANHSEIAADFIKRYSERNGKLKYWAEKFWRWNGAYWTKVIDHDIMAFIANEYGHLPTAKKAPDHSGIKRVAASLINAESLAATTTNGVNFANGVLTDEGILVPHDPDFGKTYVLPYSYDIKLADQCHTFLKFLHDCWGHHEDYQQQVMALQEALGVTLFGQATKYQRAFLLQGLASTGKSQLLKIVEQMMPIEARCYISPYMWSDKFAPAQMAGKLVNICSELDKDKNIDGRVFKDIVSADVAISGQHKREQIFNFLPTTAHWFASNFLPKSKDTSDGFTRRWLVFIFDKIVTEEQKIIGFGEYMVQTEQAAIAAWAVEGYKRVKQQGNYTLSSSHKASEQEMREANDSFKAFAYSSHKLDWTGKVSEEDLWNAYSTWSIVHGETNRVPRKAFAKHAFSALAAKSIRMVVEQDGVRWFHGISLKK